MKSDVNNEDILESFKKVMPYLPYLYDDEVSIALTDTNQFLVNQPCKSLPTNSVPGDILPEAGAASKAIHTGKAVVREVSKELYGVPFKSFAVPLKNEEGQIVGTLLVAQNLERSKILLNISNHLSTTFEQITNAACELSEDIQKLGVMNREIVDLSKNAEKYADGTQEILNFIQKISAQSNLLGLNAAIEATRAGEAGRGFHVVAQEIRKMSINTSESINKISKVLNNLTQSISSISDKMIDSNDTLQGHITILEEVSKSMSELNDTVKTLEELSKRL